MVRDSAEGLCKTREKSYTKAKALLFPHCFTPGISVNAALSYREKCAGGWGVSVLRLQWLYFVKDFYSSCAGGFKVCIKSQTWKGLLQTMLLSFHMLSQRAQTTLSFTSSLWTVSIWNTSKLYTMSFTGWLVSECYIFKTICSFIVHGKEILTHDMEM